jgi:hypothetical protein
MTHVSTSSYIAARRIYLFRGEYIFDLEKTVVVETPQLGHATEVFVKPKSMEGFPRLVYKNRRGGHPAQSGQHRRTARPLGARH